MLLLLSRHILFVSLSQLLVEEGGRVKRRQMANTTNLMQSGLSSAFCGQHDPVGDGPLLRLYWYCMHPANRVNIYFLLQSPNISSQGTCDS